MNFKSKNIFRFVLVVWVLVSPILVTHLWAEGLHSTPQQLAAHSIALEAASLADSDHDFGTPAQHHYQVNPGMENALTGVHTSSITANVPDSALPRQPRLAISVASGGTRIAAAAAFPPLLPPPNL